MGLTRQQYLMVATLLAGAIMVVLNQTLLTPTLPVIMGDFQIEATTVQWLTSGYSLAEAIVIPLSAFFIGKFSTRQLFMGLMSIFVVGSVVAIFAPAFPILLAGRMLQAAAAGIMMAMVFTVILITFPVEKRGSAMGIVGLVISFAPAVGPSVGGLLADSIGWRAMFVVVAVLSALIIVAAFFLLSNKEGFEPTTFDLPSVFMSSIGLGSLLYGISTFSSTDNPVLTAILIVFGLAVIALFAFRQTRLEVPLLKVEVLKTRRYRTAVILVFLIQCSLIGCGVLLPIYLQNVLGTTATVSGLVMLPGAVLGAICGVLAGRLFDKHGIRGLALFGGAIMSFSSLGMIFYTETTPLIMVIIIYSLVAIGLQFLITPLNTWGVNSLENRLIPHANAVTNTFNQVGASLGTALIVSLSALGSFTSPEATGTALVMAGDHISFCAVCCILFLIFIVTIVSVRNKATDVDPRRVALEAMKPAAQSDANEHIWKVSDVMTHEYVTVPAKATIAQAVGALSKTNTSGLVVVDDSSHPVGFISDGDIMNGIAREESTFNDGVNFVVLVDNRKLQDKVAKMLEKNVMEFATKKVVSIEADFALEEAAKVLAEKRIKKLPVLHNGKLVGMISRRDIINAMAQVNRLG